MALPLISHSKVFVTQCKNCEKLKFQNIYHSIGGRVMPKYHKSFVNLKKGLQSVHDTAKNSYKAKYL